MNMQKWVERFGDDLLVADGFDDCIIGIGNCRRVIYSYSKIIENLIKQGMTEEEAVEYFDFNIGGAYVGEMTPIYMMDDE